MYINTLKHQSPEMDSTFQQFSMQSTMDEDNCRICLEPMIRERRKYCECKGNMGFIHFACLKAWAERTRKKMDTYNNIYIDCDVCKSRIYLDISMKCEFISREEICRFGSERFRRLISLLVIALAFLVLLLITLVYYLNDEVDVFYFVLSMVGSGTIVILLVFLMFFKVLLTFREEIEGFLQFPSISKEKMSRVANNFESQQTMF